MPCAALAPLPAEQRRGHRQCNPARGGGDRLPGGLGGPGAPRAACSQPVRPSAAGCPTAAPRPGRVSPPPGSGGRGPPALTAPPKRRCRGAGPPPAERHHLIFRWRQRLSISVHVYGFLTTRWCFTLLSGRLTCSRTISRSSKISLGAGGHAPRRDSVTPGCKAPLALCA